MRHGSDPLTRADTLIFNQLAWAHLVLFGILLYPAWYVEGTVLTLFVQFGQGSPHGTECGCKEDHETL